MDSFDFNFLVILIEKEKDPAFSGLMVLYFFPGFPNPFVWFYAFQLL